MKQTFISYDMTNEEYHGYPGTFSSSNLKTAIEDMELFYKMHITKEITQEHIAAFDTGTYFHTRVLEPHLLDKECIVFEGVRRGAKWEAFKEEHKGKAIVNKTQRDTAEKLADLVFNSKSAMEIIKDGVAEVSAFAELLIDWENGHVYSGDKEFILTQDGFMWLSFDTPEISETAVRLIVKTRADLLKEENGAILDLKSTTGNAKDMRKCRRKISDYEYDLSAAMYLDVFSLAMEKPFQHFYWTFASKDKHNCKTYLASEQNIKVGRAKWSSAIIKIAQAIATGWVFEDVIDVLEPEMFQLEWIKGK